LSLDFAAIPSRPRISLVIKYVTRDFNLDYKYAWRWLLLTRHCATVNVYGFNLEEEQFWRDALSGINLVTSGAGADTLLIDGDRCLVHVTPTYREIEAARSVFVVARRSQARRWRAVLNADFPHVMEYGLLPAANPRVVVPLSSSDHAGFALALHRPGRGVARLGLALARILARFRNFSLLRGQVLMIATRDFENYLGGLLEGDRLMVRGHQPTNYALYLGTPDENRKTVVLPLGSSDPATILKVAGSSEARASLQREVEALSALSMSPLANFVPILGAIEASGDTLTLCQEYRSRQKINQRQQHESIIHFLGQLSQMERQLKPLSSLLMELPIDQRENLSADEVGTCYSLRSRLKSLAESGAMFWVHRNHGDFAPWNCAWTEKGFFVFDWEESRQQAVAFGDVFYYVVAPALLIERNPSARRILSSSLHFAEQVASAGRINDVDIRGYLALWLLGRVGQGGLYSELLHLLNMEWSND
jgi:hypothetical protein